jgi:hypothetical protein
VRAILVGALLGMTAGAVLGGLLAFGVYRLESNPPPDNAWWANVGANLPRDGGPLLWQHVSYGPPWSSLLFYGLLLGGGFGSVVGAIVFGTSAIIRRLDRIRQEDGMWP